jgi:hypothetical protein
MIPPLRTPWLHFTAFTAMVILSCFLSTTTTSPALRYFRLRRHMFKPPASSLTYQQSLSKQLFPPKAPLALSAPFRRSDSKQASHLSKSFLTKTSLLSAPFEESEEKAAPKHADLSPKYLLGPSSFVVQCHSAFLLEPHFAPNGCPTLRFKPKAFVVRCHTVFLLEPHFAPKASPTLFFEPKARPAFLSSLPKTYHVCFGDCSSSPSNISYFERQLPFEAPDLPLQSTVPSTIVAYSCNAVDLSLQSTLLSCVNATTRPAVDRSDLSVTSSVTTARIISVLLLLLTARSATPLPLLLNDRVLLLSGYCRLLDRLLSVL